MIGTNNPREHIYRSHKLPISCERCFQPFKEEMELTKHRREADRCQVISRPEGLLGIDGVIVSKLKSRKGARNGTQEEKWEYMYKTIFSDVQDTEIPSPCKQSPIPCRQCRCIDLTIAQTSTCNPWESQSPPKCKLSIADSSGRRSLHGL